MASAEVEQPPRPASEQTTFSSHSYVDSEPSMSTNTNSLVTVRLSEPDSATLTAPIDDNDTASTLSDRTLQPSPEPDTTQFQPVNPDDGFIDFAKESRQTSMRGSYVAARESVKSQKTDEFPSYQEDDLFENASTEALRTRSNSGSSGRSHDSGTVDWSELEKTEEGEARGEASDESTAFLLARLEQENNALTADPRFGIKSRQSRLRGQSRPPSIHMLKKLVSNPPAKVSRYSVLPDPPPMTELEFWAALVQDYPQTAQRLPTLTSNKIKSGVPPPLRGVVWTSMVGARDPELAERFDKLCLETSPYENLIGKDIGRSFPGVEMFREAEGEGQQMLGRVLRAFSLYDTEIGYCQGLGFLVGPLLMQMGDKDAFCVLVKLMENYDLRSCFLPNLSGLHVRIYQFQRLLDQHMPELAAHLASLQVEAAYLSQWFLSFFAVTCPLPMLFRIYDIIFAEGASETIMRVALSLMRRNESKIMESKEFEEVMQLLLSRSLWEAYSCDADDMVNDFMEMTGLVSRESLQKMEASFKAQHGADPQAWYAFLPDAQSAASRFLGRLWTASTPTKGANSLEPGNSSHTRNLSSLLRKSPSKQSISTSIVSTDMSSEGNNSVGTANTDPTNLSRDSSGDALSLASKTESLIIPVPGAVTKEDKDLHSQIEDLLTALSDMQRQHSLLTTQLQREREERSEDTRQVEELMSYLRPREVHPDQRPRSLQFAARVPIQNDEVAEQRRQTMQALSHRSEASSISLPSEIREIVQKVDNRLEAHRSVRQSRTSEIFETKQRLRDSLIRSQNQMESEVTRSAMLTRQLDEKERETVQVRENLRQVQTRLHEELRKKEELERTIQELTSDGSTPSSRSGSVTWPENERPVILQRSDTMNSKASPVRVSAGTGGGGLRELKLGRSSTETEAPSQSPHLRTGSTNVPKRGSSLATQKMLATEDHVPQTEDEMLVELVNAKTSEAMARQELEEVKAKMDAMRKMLGVPSPTIESIPNPLSYHKGAASENVAATNGAKHATTSSRQGSGADKLSPQTPGSGSVASSITNSFWGWGKRSLSSSTPAPGQTQAASGCEERPKS